MTLTQLQSIQYVPCQHWHSPHHCVIEKYRNPAMSVCWTQCDLGPRLKLNQTVEELPPPVECAHPLPAPRNERLADLWREIHRWAKTADLSQPSVDAYMAQVNATLGLIGGCTCKADWTARLKLKPLDRSSNEALFNDLVDRHNEVNRALGKAEVTYDQARKMYA